MGRPPIFPKMFLATEKGDPLNSISKQGLLFFQPSPPFPTRDQGAADFCVPAQTHIRPSKQTGPAAILSDTRGEALLSTFNPLGSKGGISEPSFPPLFLLLVRTSRC